MDAERRIAELEAAVADRDAALAARLVELAERDARIAALEEQVKQLKALVEELQAKLSENSGNSGRPPSSDGPGGRRGKPSRKHKSGKKRGGQKGHKGHRRELLPVEAVDHVVEVYPPTCENCEAALAKVTDPDSVRYQVTEVPEPKPEVTEFRCHAVECTCGHRTRASLDGVAAISSIEHRVAQALESSVDEAWERVRAARVKHTGSPAGGSSTPPGERLRLRPRKRTPLFHARGRPRNAFEILPGAQFLSSPRWRALHGRGP